MKTVQIENRWIGPERPPYVIAEIGGNFLDFSAARKLIDLALECQVDAVKFQNYTADTLASRKAIFDMENTGKVSQYELFKKYEVGEKLTQDVIDYCRKVQLTCFSTPAHHTDVDLLEKNKVCAYKIGSDDANNLPLIRGVARLGKPILYSTGMCTLSEVQRSVDAMLEQGNDQIVLFHCTSNYPTHPDAVNLRAMVTMQKHFEFPVGYSDHTLGIDACYAAAVLGARVLEFHFTHDKKAEGPDHMLSKDPEETRLLMKKLRDLELMMGDGVKKPATTEMKSRINNRKSLVVTADIQKGEKFTPQNIDLKRPGFGIPCDQYENVLGKSSSRTLKRDDVLQWEDLF